MRNRWFVTRLVAIFVLLIVASTVLPPKATLAFPSSQSSEERAVTISPHLYHSGSTYVVTFYTTGDSTYTNPYFFRIATEEYLVDNLISRLVVTRDGQAVTDPDELREVFLLYISAVGLYNERPDTMDLEWEDELSIVLDQPLFMLMQPVQALRTPRAQYADVFRLLLTDTRQTTELEAKLDQVFQENPETLEEGLGMLETILRDQERTSETLGQLTDDMRELLGSVNTSIAWTTNTARVVRLATRLLAMDQYTQERAEWLSNYADTVRSGPGAFTRVQREALETVLGEVEDAHRQRLSIALDFLITEGLSDAISAGGSQALEIATDMLAKYSGNRLVAAGIGSAFAVVGAGLSINSILYGVDEIWAQFTLAKRSDELRVKLHEGRREIESIPSDDDSTWNGGLANAWRNAYLLETIATANAQRSYASGIAATFRLPNPLELINWIRGEDWRESVQSLLFNANEWESQELRTFTDGESTRALASLAARSLGAEPPPNSGGIAAISAGASHTCLLTSRGGVKCWGDNSEGQLGDGTTTSRPTPGDVIGLASGVQAISAGGWHTCALTIAGGVKCWGRGILGQLGDGAFSSSTEPVDVLHLESGVRSISAGGGHTCAITATSGVKCWGSSSNVVLDDGSYEMDAIPVDVEGFSSGAVSLSTSGTHTCVLTEVDVMCWGWNVSEPSGAGATVSSKTPLSVHGLSSGIQSIASGEEHTCALTTLGAVTCWGRNWAGQLGNGETTDWTEPGDSIPGPVNGLANGIQAISASGLYTCALTEGGGVKCWGMNSNGQLGDGTTTDHNSPIEVVGLGTSIQAVSTGGQHACALTVSGNVLCWGANDQGQLGIAPGDPSTAPVEVLVPDLFAQIPAASDVVGQTPRETPSPAPSALLSVDSSRFADLHLFAEGIASVSSSGTHVCALTISGGVKCWGSNSAGQLGDGTTEDRSTPVDVLGLSSGVREVYVGLSFSCAVTLANGVKCWGGNQDGEVGDGTFEDRYSPIDVVGLEGVVQTISTSTFHTCALTIAGGVKCWGANGSGRLGDGTNTHRPAPVDVPGLQEGVSVVGTGDAHTCALTKNSEVICWGANHLGQLGNKRITYEPGRPQVVAGLSEGVTAIAVGTNSNCALTLPGGVKCWGENSDGQLGDGSTTNRSVATDVLRLQSGIAKVFAYGRTTCAAAKSGGVWCWGNNNRGQLGDGTSVSQLSPVEVVGLADEIIAMTSLGQAICAVTISREATCWGTLNSSSQDSAQVGKISLPVSIDSGISPIQAVHTVADSGCTLDESGDLWCWGDTPRRVEIVQEPKPYWGKPQSIASGSYHTCLATTEGALYCWGRGSTLGIGEQGDQTSAIAVESLQGGVAKVVAGGENTCAVMEEPAGLWCWGNSNLYGQLGDGTIGYRHEPAKAILLSGKIREVTLGSFHSCAIMDGGAVKCWGSNGFGQLGNGVSDASYQSVPPTPVDVVGLDSGVVAITAGESHTCALLATGGVKCWGDNLGGRLGNGTGEDSYVPVDVLGLDSGVQEISSGLSFTCALTVSGAVMCWGAGASPGGIGDGIGAFSLVPVDVIGLDSGVKAIDAGNHHACAIIVDGSLLCWGSNSAGQLGDGTTEDRLSPVVVAGIEETVVAVAAGGEHTCAITVSRVMCWGSNGGWGQLGNQSLSDSLVPVEVIGFSEP